MTDASRLSSLDFAELLGEDVLAADELEALSEQHAGLGNPEIDFDRGPEIPRIRPILVVLAARATGQVTDPDLQRAAELLHIALAVHDLALGREGGRRRRVARKLARRTATWLGGNHFTLRAMELAQATRPDVLGDLLATLREFADGHALMEELQSGRTPTRDDWLEHADQHTGALFAFCCRVGAKTTTDRALPEALARYGRHLGRMWHIAEDLSIFTHQRSEPAIVARALAGRPMLPVALAAENSPSIGRLWGQLVQHPSDATASWIATLVAEAGGLAEARERMIAESWRARQALAPLPDSAHRAALHKLVGAVCVASVRGPRAASFDDR